MRFDWSIAIVLAAMLSSRASAFDAGDLPRLDVTPAERNILEQLIEQVQTEARQVLADQKIATAEPDFATRFGQQVNPEALGIIVLMRTHRDPFIDAYTRWQLLSFDPVLPELTTQQFLTVMRQTPALRENPWANRTTLELFIRAETEGPLRESDRNRLQELELELKLAEDIARHLNHPAEQFRTWISEQLGETGLLPRLWLLEQCMATINAGWPTRSIKSRISRNFADSIADESFTERDRKVVALIAEDLAGHKRQYISQFAIKADGSLDARFSTAQVTTGDVEKWRNRLFDRVLE